MQARPASQRSTPAHPYGPSRRGLGAGPFALVFAALLPTAAPAAPQGTTERIGQRNVGLPGDSSSSGPALSADGRYVAFHSYASNLVAGDTNGTWDVFVRDRVSGEVERVSVSSGGSQGNGASGSPSISADGRYVAFSSLANNLVPGDTNSYADVFVHDRDTGTTTRVSLASNGSQGSLFSGAARISGDGRYVVFQSFAPDLVPGDTNLDADIFVHDRQTGVTRRVSVDSAGNQAQGYSGHPGISHDGRYVAFMGTADNLVPGDTNGVEDIFVHDRQTGETRRVSIDSAGAQAGDYSDTCAISGDGRYVAFASEATNLVPGDTNGFEDIFVHDRVSGVTTRVSLGSGGVQSNQRSFGPRLSHDGRMVSFLSEAQNLVPGDTNGVTDVFVHDRQLGETRRVSVSTAGAQADALSFEAAVSAAGDLVVLSSMANNLVAVPTPGFDDVYLHELASAQTTIQSVCGPRVPGAGLCRRTEFSADGRFVVFESGAPDLVAGDTNGAFDVFVLDRRSGVTERVSVSTAGIQGNDFSIMPQITHDGRYVVFTSAATNLVPGDTNGTQDVFLRDRWNGTTERVSVGAGSLQANGLSQLGTPSADARFIAFASAATNLVPSDTNGFRDIFVRDRLNGTTQRVSVSSTGVQANLGVDGPMSISANGRYVCFVSLSNNLVPGDTSSHYDAFVHDRDTGQTTLVSVSSSGQHGNYSSNAATISADGRFVTFTSGSSNLVPGDVGDWWDVFVHDRWTGQTERVSVDPLGNGGNGISGENSPGAISLDGRYVAFWSKASNLVPGDTNAAGDIFVRDRTLGLTQRVSVSSSGAQSNGTGTYFPSISWDGRFVGFSSDATNLVAELPSPHYSTFLHDRLPNAPTPFCYGDGSGAPCPCGNAGYTGHGCRNAIFPNGCRLVGNGDASLSADTFVLSTSDSAPSQPGLFFQGNQAIQGGAGIAFGDGLRCAGGGVVRLQSVQAGPGGLASTSLPLSLAGGPAPGDVRRYQWWYRDPFGSPCGSGFNYSNGLEVTWTP